LRVWEGIVTSIGSAVSYKDVLENPDRISKVVLQKGLDSGTAFEILSVDIADVDIGDNVGAKLQAEQAEADKVSPKRRQKRERLRRQEKKAYAGDAALSRPRPKSPWRCQKPSAAAISSDGLFEMKNIQSDTACASQRRPETNRQLMAGGQFTHMDSSLYFC
jgi:uncharacterized protein YqfA (UPF0365 family)